MIYYCYYCYSFIIQTVCGDLYHDMVISINTSVISCGHCDPSCYTGFVCGCVSSQVNRKTMFPVIVGERLKWPSWRCCWDAQLYSVFLLGFNQFGLPDSAVLAFKKKKKKRILVLSSPQASTYFLLLSIRYYIFALLRLFSLLFNCYPCPQV